MMVKIIFILNIQWKASYWLKLSPLIKIRRTFNNPYVLLSGIKSSDSVLYPWLTSSRGTKNPQDMEIDMKEPASSQNRNNHDECELKKADFFSRCQLNYLVRELHFSKSNVKLLTSRLQQRNLLSQLRTWVTVYTGKKTINLLSMFIYCLDVLGILKSMVQSYHSEEAFVHRVFENKFESYLIT